MISMLLDLFFAVLFFRILICTIKKGIVFSDYYLNKGLGTQPVQSANRGNINQKNKHKVVLMVSLEFK